MSRLHRSVCSVIIILLAVSHAEVCVGKESVLNGKIICLDAGHGGTSATDQYRKGPSGEREEWANLRVAKILRELLQDRGANVVMTRDDDTSVGLKERADMARAAKAQVFLSIHHNATADRSVNFPIIYYHAYAGQNEAGVRLAKLLAQRLNQELFGGKAEPSVCSDHTIFSTSGTAVLRHSYGIPGVLGEATFFTNAEEETRLKDPEHNRREAEAYVAALEDFFTTDVPRIGAVKDADPLPPFPAFQEAQRMSELAKRWREDYEEGRRLMEGPSRDPQRAYDLLTRSVKSFPDSHVARECHVLRAQILEEQGKADEARQERRRADEFYSKL
jgi:N-acetylmuramoyl-L-alanine amidase